MLELKIIRIKINQKMGLYQIRYIREKNSELREKVVEKI